MHKQLWRPLPLLFALTLVLGVIAMRGTLAAFVFNLARIELGKPLVQNWRTQNYRCVAYTFDPNPAQTFLNFVSVVNPSDQQLDLWLGNLAWTNGECFTAFGYWQANVAVNTRVAPSAGVFLTLALQKQGLYDQAVEVARQVKLTEYIYHLGYGREVVGDLPNAIAYYRLAIDAKPMYLPITRLAQLYSNQNDSRSLNGLWEKVASATSENDLLHALALADLAAQRQEWDSMIAATDRAAQLTTDTHIQFDLYLRLGRTLEKGRQIKVAIDAYNQAINIAATNSYEPYIAIARLYADQKNTTTASEYLQHVVVLFSQDPWVHIRAGEILETIGNMQSARDQIIQGVSMHPQDFSILWTAAQFEIRQGKRNTAIDYLERASQTQHNCETRKLLANTWASLNEPAKANRIRQMIPQQCNP